MAPGLYVAVCKQVSGEQNANHLLQHIFTTDHVKAAILFSDINDIGVSPPHYHILCSTYDHKIKSVTQTLFRS